MKRRTLLELPSCTILTVMMQMPIRMMTPRQYSSVLALRHPHWTSSHERSHGPGPVLLPACHVPAPVRTSEGECGSRGEAYTVWDTQKSGNEGDVSASSHPRTQVETLTRAVPAAHLLRHSLRASLSDFSRSIVTLLRPAAALICVCTVLIGAVLIPLKRHEEILLSGNPVNRHVVVDSAGGTSEAVRAPLPCNLPRPRQRFGRRAPRRLRLQLRQTRGSRGTG